jgi:riboflavin kinase/FMN adenylyltransferase
MIVSRDPAALPRADRAVALGTFDGVHLGHQAVMRAAIETGLRSTVITFSPHPREVLGYEVRLLTTLERKIEHIRAVGVDELVIIEFTPELARLSPAGFVAEVLEPLQARVILAGGNFRFGHGRSGDGALLAEMGFDVRAVPLVEGVSSSRIRRLLEAGEAAAAAALLGRPHELEGIVVSGDQRGETLGFPTANLAVPPNLLVPAYGIYAGQAVVGEARFRTALSIGVNPHYGGHERRIEAFLLDFEGDLYGVDVRLELWQRLREERSFASEQALIDQIALDVASARAAVRPGADEPPRTAP